MEQRVQLRRTAQGLQAPAEPEGDAPEGAPVLRQVELQVGAALPDRPNLAVGGDPVARARELLEERAAAYAECHATLGAAHVLWSEGHLKPGHTARFHTRSGLLTCDRRGDWIEMNFPAKLEQPADPPAQLAEALGAEIKYTGRNQFDYLVEVADEATLRALAPKHHLLRELPVRGVIATARGSGEFDFVSRFFAPGSGIDEDPVTGSAHCALAPYWASRLGKTEMTGFQASPRGGVVKVRLEGDRVLLMGQAVIVLRGELLI